MSLNTSGNMGSFFPLLFLRYRFGPSRCVGGCSYIDGKCMESSGNHGGRWFERSWRGRGWGSDGSDGRGKHENTQVFSLIIVFTWEINNYLFFDYWSEYFIVPGETLHFLSLRQNTPQSGVQCETSSGVLYRTSFYWIPTSQSPTTKHDAHTHSINTTTHHKTSYSSDTCSSSPTLCRRRQTQQQRKNERAKNFQTPSAGQQQKRRRKNAKPFLLSNCFSFWCTTNTLILFRGTKIVSWCGIEIFLKPTHALPATETMSVATHVQTFEFEMLELEQPLICTCNT